MTINVVKTIQTKNTNEIQLIQAESRFSKIEGKVILFIGVVHGDEPEGEFLIYNLINEIKQDMSLIKDNKILFIPVLNPDGKALGTRTNANKVDLNRNFPTKNWVLSAKIDEFYSGQAPASEIETKFLIDILNDYKPDLIFTIHKPYELINYDGPAEHLAKMISELTGYPVRHDIGYPTPGSFGTYAGVERDIPVITLELPDNTDLKKLWITNKEAFLSVISA